jgi:hypothetical protein
MGPNKLAKSMTKNQFSDITGDQSFREAPDDSNPLLAGKNPKVVQAYLEAEKR